MTAGRAFAAALAVAASSGEAAAAACQSTRGFTCSAVSAPEGADSQRTIRLHVERLPARRGTQGVTIALVGGPGQAATLFAADIAELLNPVLSRQDLVVFDQRGTGRSGALRCRALDVRRGRPLDRAAARCATQIGVRRRAYTTAASVGDIEHVRASLGVERVSLVGISFGTKVALAYAAAFPSRVERLVLDSPVAPDGPDPLYRDTFRALPRVLGRLCRRSPRCVRGRWRLTDDLQRVAQRTPGRRGLGRAALVDLLLQTDLDPDLGRRLPTALHAAARGRAEALLALAPHNGDGGRAEPERFSEALNAATVCGELRFPWSPSVAPGERVADARRRLRRLPRTTFHPFGLDAALGLGPVELCRRWPDPPRPTKIAARLAAVHAPALILSGELDLRTPRETAAQVQWRLPAATLEVVPGIGHSVLSTDRSGRARRALAGLFAGIR